MGSFCSLNQPPNWEGMFGFGLDDCGYAPLKFASPNLIFVLLDFHIYFI